MPWFTRGVAAADEYDDVEMPPSAETAPRQLFVEQDPKAPSVVARILHSDAALLQAAHAAEITDVTHLNAVIADAKIGAASILTVRAEAKKHAIIAYGPEMGAAKGKTIDALPAGDALDGYAAHMKEEALKKAPEGGSQAKTLGTQPSGVTFAQDAQKQDAKSVATQTEDSTLRQTALGRRAQELRQKKA